MDTTKKILFVDDEPAFLDSLKRLLRKHHQWQLFFAEGAHEALGIISEVAIDVVVSDVQMPGKSGLDLLETLQKDSQTRGIPVIILTGSTEKDLKRKALDLGATDLLNKPISYEDLITRISNSIKLKSYQDEIKNQNILLEEKVQLRTAELEFLHQDIIWRLAKAGELRDEETGDHLLRVAHHCEYLATRLGLEKKKVKMITFTSCLHDLGKIGIPDTILLKQEPLTSDEWKIMQTHTEIGASILLEAPNSSLSFGLQNWHDKFRAAQAADTMRQTAAAIAISHHEKWDGSGYPRGLKGDAIPIEGRIVALADVYDALRSKRPYKAPFSADEAASIIIENKGIHLDPQLVTIFEQNRGRFEAINDEYT